MNWILYVALIVIGITKILSSDKKEIQILLGVQVVYLALSAIQSSTQIPLSSIFETIAFILFFISLIGIIILTYHQKLFQDELEKWLATIFLFFVTLVFVYPLFRVQGYGGIASLQIIPLGIYLYFVIRNRNKDLIDLYSVSSFIMVTQLFTTIAANFG